MENEERLSSADIKKQIEAKKEELKNSGLPITGQMANEINASASTPEKAQIKTEPEGASEGVEDPKQEDPALKEWAKKKGIDWTTEDSVLAALRKSDQAFHEKRSKERTQEPPPYQGYQPPAPTWVPPQQTQPNLTYYQPPVNNRAMLENLGRQYNMLPEDVERMLAFNKDFFEVASRAERERTQKEMDAIKRENQKNSVFRELASDPVFRKPEVAVEFQRALEEMQSGDPHSFENDPNAYRRAYERAQLSVFRKNLQGQELQEGVPPTPRLPMNPPRNLGQGSGGGAQDKENQMDMKAYIAASPSEKKKLLEKMGLVSQLY